MNKLEITQCINGYRVNWTEDDVSQEVVCEEPETENGELEAMRNLLYVIKEYFGVFYSKHNENNLCIEIK
jgi:hypothetical protein